MHNAYVVTGQLVDEKTVALDENLSLSAAPMRVRVIIEPFEQNKEALDLQSVLDTIHRRQKARGFIAPSAEDIEARLQMERASWE